MSDITAEPTPDELAPILAGFRDDAFARWFIFAFATAAHTHPEEIRKAIGTAFSTAAIEEANKRLSLILAQNQARLNEVLDRLRKAESEMSQLSEQFAFLRSRCKLMNDWMNRKAAELKRPKHQEAP